MFDISWSHILILGTVAVVVIGPKELPATMRTIGRGVNKLRRMAGEFQGQFNEALKEANLEDVKKEFDVLRQSAASLSSSASPLGLARNALSSSIFQEDSFKNLTQTPSAIAPAVAPAMQIEPAIASSAAPIAAAGSIDVDIPSAFAPLALFKR